MLEFIYIVVGVIMLFLFIILTFRSKKFKDNIKYKNNKRYHNDEGVDTSNFNFTDGGGVD